MTDPSHPRTGRRVLVVAAHADDETLGAGGTLAAHTAAGDTVAILILSTSVGSRDTTGHTPAEPAAKLSHQHDTATHRRRCAQQVAQLYRADLTIADLPDNRFDTLPSLTITQHVETAIRRHQPTIVYTHSAADLSRDHQLTATATMAATRPQPGCPVRTVLAMEVRSATDWASGPVFRPTWHQPLEAAQLGTKVRALEIYSSEMRPWPHSRSTQAITALAAHRGAQVGVAAAEAFELLRHLPAPPGR